MNRNNQESMVRKGPIRDRERPWQEVGPRIRNVRSAAPKSAAVTATASRFEILGISENEEDTEVNQGLHERFSRRQPLRPAEQGRGQTTRPRMRLNLSIREYFRKPDEASQSSAWLAQQEIPTAEEINNESAVEISVNQIKGSWECKDKYLQAHYELFRDDAVAPIRDAVMEVKETPEMMEKDSKEHAGIYENVYITGMTFAPQGIAVRIMFSLRRAGKKIRWEQSKRLTSGSIVVLTPADDMFRSVCKVAIVAARPLAGLLQKPPVIDIYFGSTDEIEIDPQQEWVMVEARQGFYEAYRHTLQALQKMSRESFPLAEYLVDVEKDVGAPKYIKDQPLQDLSMAFMTTNDEYLNVDVLTGWPKNADSELDESQVEALRRILTKRLAIVQGPPGTGKTHVSVVGLRTLLANTSKEDPPIIVAAQTNHALDQLLRHVAAFEPEFIRLGGRTVDKDIIKPRTLYEVRKASPPPNLVGGLRGPAMSRKKEIVNRLTAILGPLTLGTEPIAPQFFLQLGLITQRQCDSIESGAAAWVNDRIKESMGAVGIWLGQDLIGAERRVSSEDYGFEYEEVDQEFEQLREIEAESSTAEEDDFETLHGDWIALVDPFTGRKTTGVSHDKLIRFLQEPDMWQIPDAYRGLVYSHLQRTAKEMLCTAFRQTAGDYNKMTHDLKIGRWEVDSAYLQQARIIGMTTTGLSKYRGLLASLKPRVVLIEEAAETLEAHVIAACFDTLQHLILVGDHQQLRGHCAVPDLEGDPYYLDVSMFERLVGNDVEFSRLSRQRRMIPEIRKILGPIYENLEDHPCVLDRAPVPGMGGVNSFFISHRWPESTDDAVSKNNRGEADMIVGFFDYLVLNGTNVKDITVLTFYNGQRKTILAGLRNHRNLQGVQFKVVTVDSYQGEENEIVLLSLVRNNPMGNIGFLSIENRVCVALSRARRGFYIFGQANLLCDASNLWKKVVQVMSEGPGRTGIALPLTCKNHGKITEVKDATDWARITGGCERPCRDLLPCGHICQLTCHPFDHASVNCQMPCSRHLPCGHQCQELCYVQPCKCEISCTGRPRRVIGTSPPDFPHLEPQQPPALPALHVPSGSNRRSPRRSPLGSPHRQLNQSEQQSPHHSLHHPVDGPDEGQAYRDYANGGHGLSDATLDAIAIDLAAHERQRKVDEEMAQALFGLDDTSSSGSRFGSDSGHNSLLNGDGKRIVRREIYSGGSVENGGVIESGTSLLD